MGMLCTRCYQELPTTESAASVQCRACNTVNEIAKPEHWNSRTRSRIQFVGAMLLNRIVKPLNLNGRHSSSSSMKRGLLIGVSYNDNKNHKLKGTVSDVKHMTNILINNFGYKAENIRILTEEQRETDFIPTKTNIQKHMRWLVDRSQAGDSLVFYFSGHGVRLPDFDGEESDGFDESICPVDFLQEGMILDDEIYASIVMPLIKGVTLHAIIDACRSGSILDLQCVYNTNEKRWTENKNTKRKHNPNGGLAISISACQDNQVAADTDAFSDDKKVNGAMTYILQDIVKTNKDLTYGKLIDQINKLIAEANQQGCLPARIVRKIFRYNWFLQTPQLSASEPFDVDSKRFQL